MSLLVAPGLLAHAAACRAHPALVRFAAYATPPQLEPEGLAMLVCALLAGLGARPVGALAALGTGLPAESEYWLVADPVSFAAGRSDIVLAGRVPDLSREDTDELLQALDGHFHDDGLSFVAPRPDLWLVHLTETPLLVTHALDHAAALGLAAALPAGEAGPQWRRWQDEMQMLLHSHPVNAGREAVGALPANAVWLWGGGRLADAGPVSHIEVSAPTGLLGDMLDGLALLGQTHAEPGSAARRVEVAPVIQDDAAATAFLDATLAPALASLERGTLRELTLVADGTGMAAAWLARPPSRWQRLAVRWRAQPFVMPAAS